MNSNLERLMQEYTITATHLFSNCVLNVRDLCHRGLARLKRDDTQGSLEDLGLAIASNPRHPMGYVYRSIALYYLKDVDAALADLRYALSLNPSLTSIHLAMAEILKWQGKGDEAVSQLQIVLKHDPCHLYAHLLDGDYRAWRGDSESRDKGILSYYRILQIMDHLDEDDITDEHIHYFLLAKNRLKIVEKVGRR